MGTVVVQMQLQYHRLYFHSIDKLRVQYKCTLSKVSSIICTETFMLSHKMNFNSTAHTVRGTYMYMYHNLEVHVEILYHTMVGGVFWIDSTN